jgi:pre-rRNA-processing protein TSR4
MNLLLQLNGDLPEKFPGHERRLYLFGCRRKTCRRKEGSVRGVRASRISKYAKTISSPAAPAPEEKKVLAPATNLGNQLFGGTSTTSGQSGGNPFSSNPFSGGSGPANPFASASSLAAKPAQKVDTASLPETFASKAKITDSATPSDPAFKAPKAPEPHEPWPAVESLPTPYPKHYLDADYETLDKPKVPEASRVTGTLEDAEMSGTSGGAEDKQLFESSMDKTFQKFADRLAQNSEQVLRYEYDGQPLLYSSTDAVGKRLAPEHTAAAVSSKIGTAKQGSGIPRCTTCGSERVFELQLTPHAITELEADEMSLEGMDWGTILMGVCTRDCVPAGTADEAVGYVEEWVGVQWEELAK